MLVVDDNRNSADALATYLGLVGFKVQTEYSGAAAISKARAWVPDVVLLDISMPEMDGFAVARNLRTDMRTSPPIIVALTAHDEKYVKDRATGPDFDAYCQKGLMLEPLVILLNELSEPGHRVCSIAPAQALAMLNSKIPAERS
ncbi:response regulator [Caballeronia sp. EK]|uniref:response regulator n=1 Tax=Caballeronia sp. EK TaxID=2767469 RepID=UPI001655FEE4|nr:response regulator [Caballeronia sp. EK]MBC8640823.1 response regulator [Caballeronia sp. EK]